MRTRRTSRRLLCAAALVAAVAAAPSPADARELGRDEIAIGWSPRAVLRRDAIPSPLPYAGAAVASGVLRYERTKGANAHRLELGVLQATLRSQPDYGYLHWPDGAAQTTAGSPLTYARVRYAYLRQVARSDALAVRLGPGLDVDIQKLEYVHHPSSIGGYFGAFALDARAEIELQLAPRHRLTATVAAPLFAWVTRSPYATNDDEQLWANRDHNGLRTFGRYVAGGELETWNRYQALRLDLRYDLALSEHWALSPGVGARILANQTPRPLVAQEYGVTLAVTASF